VVFWRQHHQIEEVPANSIVIKDGCLW